MSFNGGGVAAAAVATTRLVLRLFPFSTRPASVSCSYACLTHVAAVFAVATSPHACLTHVSAVFAVAIAAPPTVCPCSCICWDLPAPEALIYSRDGSRKCARVQCCQELGQVVDDTFETRLRREASGLLVTGFRGLSWPRTSKIPPTPQGVVAREQPGSG